ncbi:MAG TPA: peptidoglycan DD-metalloendopeptidase family protein [Candidatus Acidoferrum sp.]|jgi:murein DD-endopeptidase MepM/ murein hydrolase activator NlpD|nr:peptidoglycan DD-metalloendopeptidase family protein [Candidatus Acidoferrum sp.]
MKGKQYTFFIASSASGAMRRVRVPAYALHLLVVFAVVGGITVLAAMGSYSRMLWKAASYNALRREQDSLKQQYQALQTQVKDTNQRLDSLQSLAGEVAMAYGITRFRQTPFGLTDNDNPDASGTDASFQASVDEFSYLQKNVTAVALSSGGSRLLPAAQLSTLGIVPTLWPVVGEITGHFGERMDPFSGEGAFHAGLDIASHYGDPIRATADGVISEVDNRAGYGRLIVIDHGFGVTTCYGHLSAFNVQVGMHVRAGDVIGFEGQSGRSTGPHLHYEVRIYNTPVNPWRYLRNINMSAQPSSEAASSTPAPSNGD